MKAVQVQLNKNVFLCKTVLLCSFMYFVMDFISSYQLGYQQWEGHADITIISCMTVCVQLLYVLHELKCVVYPFIHR